MNIHHLIGQEVVVVHMAASETKTVIYGKLEKTDSGNYVVFGFPYWLAWIFSLFKKPKEPTIRFPWHAVTDVNDNMICIMDLTEEQLLEEFRKIGMVFDEEHKQEESSKQNL